MLVSDSGGILYMSEEGTITHPSSHLNQVSQVKFTIPLSSDIPGTAAMKYSSTYLSLSIFGCNGP